MTIFVRLILVSQFCFLWAALEHTFPEEFYVYITNPDPTTHYPNLPKSDEDGLCGMWVYLTAKQNDPVPQLEGASTQLTIDLRFEHPNFEGSKMDYVMNIEHDGETKKEIHICFSECPTIFDQNDGNNYTLVATTENIPRDNAIDLMITSTKSVSYIERCSYSDGKPLHDGKDTSDDEKGTTDDEKGTKDDEKGTTGDEKGTMDDEKGTKDETYFLKLTSYGVLPFVAVALFGAVVYIFKIRSQLLKGSGLPLPVPCSGSDASRSENGHLPGEPRGEIIELPQIGGSLAEASAGSSAVSDGVKFGDRRNVRSAGKKSKKDD